MSVTTAKRVVEDELQQLRHETAAAAAVLEGQGLVTGQGGSKPRDNKEDIDEGGVGIYEIESVASLREKLRTAERELKKLQSHGSSDTTSHAPGSNNDLASGVLTTDKSLVSSEELSLLQAELNDTRRLKQEREDAWMGAKKQLLEAQSEVHKLTRANQSLQQQAATGSENQALTR